MAIARDCDLGIDVELPRTVERDVATNYFARREIGELEGLAPELWLDGFFRCWTRKEAFIKATGDGLERPLDSFVVPLRDGDGPYAVEAAQGTGGDLGKWSLLPFRLAGGAIGAVCAELGHTPATLQWRQTPDAEH
ncbi:MAG: 4'-phosphopantetheinyl transferase superfamily protein [Hyphomicrobiaceae bacterium]